MSVEIEIRIFDTNEVRCLGFIVGGTGLRMDPDMAKAIIHWPQPMTL